MESFYNPISGPSLVDLDNLPWDPADRKRILDYHPDQIDEIRRNYWINGLCQPHGHKFPKRKMGSKEQHFSLTWFDKYGNWLEYSVKADKVFCLCCYLFADHVGNQGGRNIFSKEGFNSWNKPERLSSHEGGVGSAHNKALKRCEDLLNQKQSIATILHKQDDIMKRENRLRLNATIDDCRLCLKNALSFRGHDESKTSLCKGNFLEIWELIYKHNEELRKLPKAAVDESSDVSKKEQMAIVLRYVDKRGLVKESFVGLVHVMETSSSALKGQGYDGANNMCGQFNGLKAKILEEIESAYYVHCFAHQLQLVDILRENEKERVEKEIGSGILETGSGLNQELSFIRPGDTRWNSHYKTLLRLVDMFPSIMRVVEHVKEECTNPSTQNQAINMLGFLSSFEFAFYLHLMVHILGLSDILSWALQRKDQDIMEAVLLVESTKRKLQDFRESEFGDRFNEINTELLQNMTAFIPYDSFSKFDESKLMRLCEFYLYDFDSREKIALSHQLGLYIDSVRKDERYANLKGIADLARVMMEIRKHISFPLVYRLLKLTLVLPVAMVYL
ncbi:uncharacterized protein LOC143561109 [Bidens hawaiensis]|uniref:uncharacterized protein LOC143561109 n=1 Tax=Bidens hawaiensis TaxID=980011 RepID=UPI00404A26D5